MASEIIVQTIKGPTSGANANKVIIPSGQTLDASAATVVPSSGNVVQVVTQTDNSSASWTGSAWTTLWRPSFTPKYSNSTLHFAVSVNVLNEGSNSHDLYVAWRNLNGTFHRGFGKAGSLSGWNQMNNCVTYSAPAGVTSSNYLFLEMLNTGGGTAYYNYNYGNGNSTSTVTMWEVAQ